MDMNIKGLLGPNINPIRATEKVDRTIRSDSSHERDANGQQSFGDGQEKRGPMSDEQLKAAIEHLKALPAVKENKWTVTLTTVEGQRFVLLKDNLGTLIRKIPEAELWTLPIADKDAGKGQLLKRTA